MTNILFLIGSALTVLVSPEVQTMLGNGVGQTGSLFFAAMAVAAIAQLFTIRLYDQLRTLTPYKGESAFMADNFGQPTALFFFFSARLVFMATISTIILVTAGFVFNEIFLYWFPNFAFSFLLLTLMLFANMIGADFAGRLQGALVTTVLLAMLILAIAGFMAPTVEIATQTSFNPRALLLPFLMMIGMELFIFSHGPSKQKNNAGAIVMAGLIFAVLVLMLWGGAMLQVVSPDKLTASFNPHTVAARQALGQPGRIIVGIMIIAGAAATVNGLLTSLTKQTQDMALAGKIPFFLSKGGNHFPLPLFLLAACPAILMAMGMAGQDITEVYIRASLLFWLLHFACMHLAAFRNNFRQKKGHFLTALLFTAVTAGLLLTDPNQQELRQSLANIAFISAFMSILLFFITYKLSRGETP